MATLLATTALLRAAGLVNVTQLHRAFSTAALSLHRGDSLRFTNEDVFNHQVYVDAAGFNFESAEQAPGTTVDLAFTKLGVFDVQCHIHPRMHLSVTVE